jgi:hypothetical protein
MSDDDVDAAAASVSSPLSARIIFIVLKPSRILSAARLK